MVPALGLLSLAWAAACIGLAHGVPDDTSVCCQCTTLMPDKTPAGIKPQVMPAPFVIELNKYDYVTEDEVIVTLRSTQDVPFRSFILGAYRVDWAEGAPVKGELSLLGTDYVAAEKCRETVTTGINTVTTFNALVSRDEKDKTMMKFSWVPKGNHGHIEFRATFVVNDETYWVAEKSAVLCDSMLGTCERRRGQDSGLLKNYVPIIDTSTCGKGKGCYREPEGCEEPQCLYILTWRYMEKEKKVKFELGGLADSSEERYVAVGISEDKYMGDDTVFTCAHDTVEGEIGKASIYVSYNQDDPKKNIPLEQFEKGPRYSFIPTQSGSYFNGRLRCTFEAYTDLDRVGRQGNGKLPHTLHGGPKHLLFARGYAVRGQPERHGLSVEELPLASEDPVTFRKHGDFSGRASYPLAKAHGCLMIIAWVFFASIGLLMTKYYKKMWPNKRYYEQRYWFITHFNCMAAMFIFTIIGIILIFVEAGGYSEAPDLPQKAHPILGIIILVCIIINPILALIRPSEDSKCRPVFNWFHWAFGTIANVLAIPQIFIGMDFGKVQVPWWATWILVIWVIFHIIVELTLEIHQCCTHKKNKERRKKWEQLKREYPKQHHPEPEPAGRRFKRFMLCLHVCFTTLITLIMVIVIAVA